jgi:hypothetical protein
MKGSDMACKEDFGGPGRTQYRKLRTKAFCLLTTALMGDPFDVESYGVGVVTLGITSETNEESSNRKNKFPVAGLMMTLFVPLMVVTGRSLATQLPEARSVADCNPKVVNAADQNTTG